MARNRHFKMASLTIILVAFALRSVNLAQSLLLPDEAYYWLWSQHLDWAYYDHPAGVALLLRLSTALGGQGAFGVRWLNALLGTAVVALTVAVGQRLIATSAGLMAGALVALGAPFLVTSRFLYTDTLFLFIMLLNLWCFLALPGVSPRKANPSTRKVKDLVTLNKVQKPGHSLTYVLLGLTLAWLFNTKYTAYLYAAALGGWLVVERRKSLRDAPFWAAAGIAAAGLLPVLAWNAAHDWASFRWQFVHTLSTSPGAVGQTGLFWQWVTNARHAVAYHTWPVVVIATAGALALIHRRRHAETRLIIWLVALLGVPPLLSPANSPRNFIGGLLLLLLSAGAWMTGRKVERRIHIGLIAGFLAITALYSGGTVNLAGSPLQSSAALEIQRETADLPDLVATAAAQPQHSLFALDYSLAGQLWYYTSRPVATGWQQYRLWDRPNLDSVTVLSLGYLSSPLVETQLHALYTAVEGPYPVMGAQRPCAWWRASGLRMDEEEVLARLDFLTLWEGPR